MCFCRYQGYEVAFLDSGCNVIFNIFVVFYLGKFLEVILQLPFLNLRGCRYILY
jgi:hypothetical protein